MNDNDIEKSTQLLRKEHQLIESAIIAIADLIKELENGVALDRRRMWAIAHSFATYVGRWHHSKEDFLLSMIRARRGCSADYPVRSFYEEHHLVEVLIARLRKTADEYLAVADHSSENFIQSLRDVVDFYPGHMWKADHILFPLADEVLSEPDQTVLLQQFAWIDSAIGTDADEQLRAIVAEFRPQAKVA
jgi:hemerythrin-like domain-containing protein